ncbi:MAG: hypothetical protein OXT67_12770 [Zetaproteobacteria bacterium]|nr:hypothetical protein [Zetaproteobacteria bacterium]MDD9952426.1 hypothetical protein [Zetaproteobacteria bacterium]
MGELRQDVESLLKKNTVTAEELWDILIRAGWTVREPVKNQPHFSYPGCPDYVVVEYRRGAKTIQTPRLLKKYLKRVLETLDEETNNG